MGKRNIEWDEEDDFELSEADNKNFKRFFYKLLSKWYWFLLFAVIGLGISYLSVLYTQPSFKIHAKLLVSDDKKGSAGMANTALGDLSSILGGKSSVDNEVEVLKTGDLLHEMILAENAYLRYFKEGRFHDIALVEGPYTVTLLTSPDSIKLLSKYIVKPLTDNRVSIVNGDGGVQEASLGVPFKVEDIGLVSIDLNDAANIGDEDVYGFFVIPVRKVIDAFSGNLTVEVTNKNVSTIDLSFIDINPRRGEKFLEALIQRYVDRNLEDKNVIADSTLAFISARLDKVTSELAAVEDRIKGYKKNTQLTDIGEQSRLLLQNSTNYVNALAETDMKLGTIEETINYLNDKNNLRVLPTSPFAVDPSLNALVAKYNDLILQRERLLMANTEKNPIVQNVTIQIEGLRQDMQNNLSGTKRQLQLVKGQQQQQLSLLSSQLQAVPDIERSFIDMARLQQIKQAQYIFLQEKWEEVAIGRTANVSNSKLIDSAKAEEYPFAPKSKLIYLFGLIAGLAVPLLCIYIADLLNVKVKEVSDILDRTTVPVLGMVTNSGGEDLAITTMNGRSVIAEQFRALRTNLEFALNGKKTILTTSSMSGEGKSFISLNLAVVLALLGKKVLLIELDMRKPGLSKKLKLSPAKGLSHYLVRKELTLKDIIVPSGVYDGVDFISSGAIPPNPAELIQTDRTKELLIQLKEQYDYILIDTPPIGVVTDAQLLAAYADVCLYVVRQGVTLKEQLNIPNGLLKGGRLKSLQLVLNGWKHTRASAGYGGYYSYGYTYGDYDGSVKKPFWKKLFRKN